MVTYDGNMGICRFFQMNPNTPAMIPKTTSVTATKMPMVAAAGMEQTSVWMQQR